MIDDVICSECVELIPLKDIPAFMVIARAFLFFCKDCEFKNSGSSNLSNNFFNRVDEERKIWE